MLKEFDDKGVKFGVPVQSVDAVVRDFITDGKLDEALQFLQPEEPTGNDQRPAVPSFDFLLLPPEQCS